MLFSCTKCPMKFATEGGLKGHMVSHDDGTPTKMVVETSGRKFNPTQTSAVFGVATKKKNPGTKARRSVWLSTPEKKGGLVIKEATADVVPDTDGVLALLAGNYIEVLYCPGADTDKWWGKSAKPMSISPDPKILTCFGKRRDELNTGPKYGGLLYPDRGWYDPNNVKGAPMITAVVKKLAKSKPVSVGAAFGSLTLGSVGLIVWLGWSRSFLRGPCVGLWTSEGGPRRQMPSLNTPLKISIGTQRHRLKGRRIVRILGESATWWPRRLVATKPRLKKLVLCPRPSNSSEITSSLIIRWI